MLHKNAVIVIHFSLFLRNQYIDLMNMSRSSKRFGFFRRSGKELLPVKPVDNITILPWWIVQLGFVTEEDMKLNADKAEVIKHNISKL